jgi:hypothetical protein
MLVSVPWFLMDIATYGVGLFIPVIVSAIHLSSTTPGSAAAEFADAKGTGTIDLFFSPVSLSDCGQCRASAVSICRSLDLSA